MCQGVTFFMSWITGTIAAQLRHLQLIACETARAASTNRTEIKETNALLAMRGYLCQAALRECCVICETLSISCGCVLGPSPSMNWFGMCVGWLRVAGLISVKQEVVFMVVGRW